MSSLKEKLIRKIQKTEDRNILEEVYRLLEIDFDDHSTYTLSNEQKSAIQEARDQIKKGQFLSEEQANQQVEEWLKRR